MALLRSLLLKLLRQAIFVALSLNIMLLDGQLAHAQQQGQQQQLDDLQQEIKSRQAKIKKQLNDAKKLQAVLKKNELGIATTVKSLNQTEASLNSNNQRQQALKKQQNELQTALEQQKKVLAKQIRSAYMTGNYDFAKMLLNQQDAAKFERTISYYQYLNKARTEQITSFRDTVKNLQQVNLELVEKQKVLEGLRKQQVQQQQTLNAQQQSRQDTLKGLQAAIQSDAARVEELQANEQNLFQALQEAQRAADAEPATLEGLAKFKGRLIKPTDGRVRRLFGNKRQGQVRWKGILINGNSGSSVVAIHNARVLYADWLRGFGLVTVLDHGDGFMSLYGHNQALLKQAGDHVKEGETIALVGQSGGQNSPSLYFEIRHKGKPVNPTQWLKL